MSDFFGIILFAIFIVVMFIYTYYWLQMFSCIKGDKPPLAFFNIGYLFSPDKFDSEGNKYRKKALIILLIGGTCMIVMFSLGRYVSAT